LAFTIASSTQTELVAAMGVSIGEASATDFLEIRWVGACTSVVEMAITTA